ncbi:MAG: CDGSH iron-sulfur domain-containing protein [Planctomycetota bacterium]
MADFAAEHGKRGDRPDMPEPPGAPRKGPYVFLCEAGRKYAYCMCQQSARFPICDGTHRELSPGDGTSGSGTSGWKPIKVIPDEARSVAWCACGTSRTKPYCDGSHENL